MHYSGGDMAQPDAKHTHILTVLFTACCMAAVVSWLSVS